MRNLRRAFLIFILLLINLSSTYDAEAKGDNETSFEIKPGILSLTSSFEKLQFDLKEGEKTAYANPGELTIIDATGSGHGWHVTVKASPLTKMVDGENEAVALQSGLLSLSLKEARIKRGEGSGTPPSWVGGRTEYIIDSGNPVTLLSAGIDQGMGTYSVLFGSNALKLKIPEKSVSQKTTYQSVLTWSIQQGP